MKRGGRGGEAQRREEHTKKKVIMCNKLFWFGLRGLKIYV